MYLKRLLIAGVSVMALATSASAVTVFNGGSVSAGDIGIGNGFTEAGEALSFTYTAATDLRVLDFVSVSSVGFSGGTDLALVTYGYNSTDVGNFSGSYSSFTNNLATTEANSTISGFDLLAGQSFTLFFAYDAAGAQTTSHQYSFATEALAPVPVPAAGMMLLTALGAAAAMRRKSNA